MDKIDALRQVRDLLADEANWTKGLYARDAEREEISWMHEDATQWCMTGALRKVCGVQYSDNGPYTFPDPFRDAIAHLAQHLPDCCQEGHGNDAQRITCFNDSSTHEGIRALLGHATGQPGTS